MIDSFYKRREWRELRYATLRRYGFACMACGFTVSEKSKGLHVDHIKPRSIFPELALDPENVQVLCADCNIGKSNKFDDDLRQDPRERPINSDECTEYIAQNTNLDRSIVMMTEALEAVGGNGIKPKEDFPFWKYVALGGMAKQFKAIDEVKYNEFKNQTI